MKTTTRVRAGLLTAAMAVTVATVTTPTASAESAESSAGRNAAIQQVLDQSTAQGGVPGMVAEVRDGHRTWFGKAGVADTDTGRARARQDRFRIGSVTKAFTATLALKLVADGKLSLDDTVEQWLPGLVKGNGNDGSAITIRHLLHQTSGLKSPDADDPERLIEMTTPAYLEHRFDKKTPEELVGIALKYRPYFAPGGAPEHEQGPVLRYSNANYLLLGRIIEKASGRTYAEELSSQILRPLGLTDTYLPRDGELDLRGQHTKEYSKLPLGDANGKVYDVTEVDPSWPWATGGIVSTTDDLGRFVSALLGGRLFPAAMAREMWDTVTVDPGARWIDKTRYGMGTFQQTLGCGVTVYGTAGAIPGSWTYSMGTRDGKHLVTGNMSGDWVNPLTAFAKVLEAKFCPAGAK
ncbi:beta-lactamase family protein [Solihabitans fulvus]|uniref:Beta-lactamase family protein n=1 Tax=Solihabitans fulvus TaxID=1892852 RepID=A0A5B2XFE2_9PSEU|nr:serine hydrolase domain-containing protein [Solihabitans fulvus]KAA2261976.1 beta-lactamase family protein [Solihabitans fulvus]